MKSLFYLCLSIIIGSLAPAQAQNYFVGFIARPVDAQTLSPGHTFVLIGKGNPLQLDLNSPELITFGLYPPPEAGVKAVFTEVKGEIRQETKAQIAAGVEPYYFQLISEAEYHKIQDVITTYKTQSAGLDYQGLLNNCVHFVDAVAGSLSSKPVLPEKVSFQFPTEYIYSLFMLNDPYGKQYKRAYELLVKSMFDWADTDCSANCTGEALGRIISGRFKAPSFFISVQNAYSTPAQGVNIVKNSSDWTYIGNGDSQETHAAAQTFANAGKAVVAVYRNNLVIVTPGQLTLGSWQLKIVSVSSYDDENDNLTFTNGLISRRFSKTVKQDVEFYLFNPKGVQTTDYLAYALEGYRILSLVGGVFNPQLFALREFFRSELTISSDQELDQLIKNLNRKALSEELKRRGINENAFLTKLEDYLKKNSSTLCDDELYNILYRCN